MKLRNLLILLMFFASIVPSCKKEPTRAEVDATVQKFLKTGRIDRAIAYLQERLRQHPDEKTLHRLVDLLSKREQWRDASAVLAEYVSRHEASAHTWYLLGHTRHMERKDDAAIDALGEALKRDPTSVEAIELLGRIYEVHGYEKEAEALYLKVATDTSKGRALLPILQRLATLEVKSGKYERAEQHLRIALTIDSGNPKASERLALLLMRRNKLQEALEVVEKWGARHPKDPGAHLFRGRILRKMGKDDEAMRELYEATDLDDSNVDALTELSDMLFTRGKYDDAFKTLMKAIALAPDSKAVNRMLAPLYFARGMYGAAWKSLEAWGDRAEPRYWVLRARIKEALGDYDAAYDAAMKALTLVTEPSPGLMAWAGILARESGHYEKAVKLLEKAADSGKFDDPLLSVWGAAPVSMTETDVMREYALALFLSGRERDGAKVLSHLFSKGDQMAGIWLAAFELRRKNASRALSILRKVKPQDDTENLFYSDVLAQALEARGDYVGAMNALTVMTGLARNQAEQVAIQKRMKAIQEKLRKMSPSQRMRFLKKVK